MTSRLPFLLLGIIGIILALNSTTGVASSLDEAENLFVKAQASYREGLEHTGKKRRISMLKAANQFESLVRLHGLENGKLFYNIGNAYLEAGERGKAILYYRKAERLTPGFYDLTYNLNLARRELQLPAPEKEWWSDIARALFFWHFMFDYQLRRIVAVTLFVFIWILLTATVFNRHYLIKSIIFLNLFFFVAFGGSFLVSAYRLHLIEAGVVTSVSTPTRKGPGFSYEKVYEQNLPAGTEFRLLKKQGEWWKVRLPSGDDLWLHNKDADLI